MYGNPCTKEISFVHLSVTESDFFDQSVYLFKNNSMKKINFTFLRNKFFLAGFIAGVVISALLFVLITSVNNPSPDKSMLKGTMTGSYVPAMGDQGTVQNNGSTCNYQYVDVIFDSDSSQGLIHCHSDGVSAGKVEITSITSGSFCSGKGIFVTTAGIHKPS